MTIDQAIEEVRGYVERGYLAVRAQCAIPGLPSTYGVSKDKLFYEPATLGSAGRERLVIGEYMRHVPKLFERLRPTYGDGSAPAP